MLEKKLKDIINHMSNNEKNEILDHTLKEVIDNLPYKEKNELYRYLWYPYVVEDVELCLNDNYDLDDYTEDEIENLVKTVANNYVYNGKYDCNISYWNNLENMIENEIK